jgi:SET domain-containing protein
MIVIGASAGRGRGIFATQDIPAETVIETCPVIALPPKDLSHIERTELYNYFFKWENGGLAICLGNGSIFNHSYAPNARYDKEFDDMAIRFVAIRPIEAGEEITVNYNGNPHDQTRIWFDTL